MRTQKTFATCHYGLISSNLIEFGQAWKRESSKPAVQNELKEDDSLGTAQNAARRAVILRLSEPKNECFEVLEPNLKVIEFFYKAACFNEWGGLDYCQIEAKARMMRLDVDAAHIAGLDYIYYGVRKDGK